MAFPLLGFNLFVVQTEEIIPEAPGQLPTQHQVTHRNLGVVAPLLACIGELLPPHCELVPKHKCLLKRNLGSQTNLGLNSSSL